MFRTQYDRGVRFHCEPGQREHVSYGGHYDEKGRVVLEEIGRVNLYDEIQSHAESCDIHVLMDRYRRFYSEYRYRPCSGYHLLR